MTVSFGSSVSLHGPEDELKINLGDVASGISPGLGSSFYTVPWDATISGWYITGYPVGSIDIDILKAPNNIPTSLQSIAGSERPFLSGAQLNSNLSVSTWNRSLRAGDVLGINILSASSLLTCVVTLRITRG